MIISKKKELKSSSLKTQQPKTRSRQEQAQFDNDFNKAYNEIMSNLRKSGLNTGGIYSRWAMDDAFNYAESQENERKLKQSKKSLLEKSR